ncbi:MAG: tRNA dihydrouridine synthase DusB [Opitutales bacterium]|nr:tRNA dihydrouridine synthase DusB [Opitutales bacterium]
MALPWFSEGRFPLFLAPMAGFTDKAFRQLCKEQGADVMVTEFVMANRFLDERSQNDAWKTVDFTPEQRPMGVQIFGSDPEKMAEAARRIVDRLQPDFIDLNYGCPAQKIVDNCAGSSLLRDLPLLGRVTAKVVERVGEDCPVTAKMRIGWDAESIVADEAAKVLEEAGVQALAVHGRTKEQGYRGDANWDIIEGVAEVVSIPVVGNGSADSVERIRAIRERGKVAGIMIGRAALGYPWLFREFKAALEGGPIPPSPDLTERMAVMLRYCRELNAHKHEDGPWGYLNWMRARLKSFTKIMPGCRSLRTRIDKVESYEELEALAEAYLAEQAAIKASEDLAEQRL